MIDFLPTAFVVIATFIFGTIIGSFLNVVALRFNTGKGLGGRSKCMSCSETLHWYDMIPVLSWFFLSGKCRKCNSAVSSQYPLVEFFTGLIFAGVAFKYSVLLDISVPYFLLFSVFVWLTMSLLIVIAVYDIRHKIIPDALSFLLACAGLLRLFIDWGPGGIFRAEVYLDLLAGVSVALVFFMLWYFSSGKWMGLGDAKLVLGMVWFLGIVKGISAVVLSFWIGSVICLLAIWYQKITSKKSGLAFGSEVPFAPFLIAGFIIAFFFGFDVLGLKTFLLLYTG